MSLGSLNQQEVTVEIMRSLLFVPGNRRDMQEKAVSFTADILVPDMEDSVPVGEKSAARNVISDMLPVLAQAGHKLVVRVNALDTGWLEEDLAAAVSPHTYGVNVGKVENAWDVQEVDKIIAGVEAKAGLDRGTHQARPVSGVGVGDGERISPSARRLRGS